MHKLTQELENLGLNHRELSGKKEKWKFKETTIYLGLCQERY